MKTAKHEKKEFPVCRLGGCLSGIKDECRRVSGPCEKQTGDRLTGDPRTDRLLIAARKIKCAYETNTERKVALEFYAAIQAFGEWVMKIEKVAGK